MANTHLKLYFLQVALLLISGFAWAQPGEQAERKPNVNFKSRHLLADDAIVELKNGALVVMLKQREKSADAYRKAGQENVALKIENNQRKENLALVQAVKGNFSFCKYYFVFTKDIDKLNAGERKGIFLNDSLEYDAAISMSESFYLIGSIDMLYETAPLPSDSMAVVNTGTALYDKAFVISYPDMTQLRKPFPRAVRLFSVKSYAGRIKLINSDLLHFYKRATK